MVAPRPDDTEDARHHSWRLTLGASPEPGGVRFRVWAPAASRVDVVLYRDGEAAAVIPLVAEEGGYHGAMVAGIGPGARYRYRLDGADTFPDPASRSQPDGVHGASEVVDPDAFEWTDTDRPTIAGGDLVIYELHVGTFTPGGTFDSAIERLDHLAALGVTAIEVMPIASFAGTRNWGYDGVGLYAPAAPYGGPGGFRRLVDAAHRRGLAVVLDVVYNHLGPEGNYLPAITGGRFFTSRHHTPWGDAVNYDGPDSGPVRDFVIQNVLYWAHEYHVDGFRLDATHAILDDSPTHILQEIAGRLHALRPPRLVIAEDERNERRLLLPPDEGGFGLDAVWADDLHHELRRLVAGDTEGYFGSYTGSIRDVVTTLRKGWFFEGRESGHGGAPRGTPADGLPPRAFVQCIQNHDQVGNRALGDRLHHSIGPSDYRALSALLILSPYTPLLWMGQEWMASAPFLYFTDHPVELGRLVTEGRREEFAHFSSFADPAMREEIPDPQAVETFRRSVLCWEEREGPPHAGVLTLYRELLGLRRSEPALRTRDRAHFAVAALGDHALALRRWSPAGDVLLLVVRLAGGEPPVLDRQPETRAPAGHRWSVVLSTEDERFGGARLDARSPEIDAPGAVLFRAGPDPEAKVPG